MYCIGFRWADGVNLQMMMGVQALYHDIDHPHGMPLNSALAERRWLCRLGSLGALGLQLTMPAFLLAPSRGALAAAFCLAASFHAGNHFLWCDAVPPRPARAPRRGRGRP